MPNQKQDRFDKLYAAHSEQLFRYAFYLLGHKEDAEDVVQTVFVNAWNRLGDIRIDEELPYLMRSVKNTVINYASKKQKQLQFTISISGQQSEQHHPLFEMEMKEFHKRLEMVLNELSTDQREVFLLSRVEGMKYKQIAETIGVSQKAIEKRMSKALQFLREKIKGINW